MRRLLVKGAVSALFFVSFVAFQGPFWDRDTSVGPKSFHYKYSRLQRALVDDPVEGNVTEPVRLFAGAVLRLKIDELILLIVVFSVGGTCNRYSASSRF